ncbi:hypothetical protein [Streptomyces narbonensis]
MTDTTVATKSDPPASLPEAPPTDPFDRDDLPAPEGATGGLLRSLLATHRLRVTAAALVLLLKEAAVQAGPLLVAYAIDRGVPAFRAGDHGPVVAVALGYLLCAALSGLLQYAFVRVAARVNQDVLGSTRLRGPSSFRHAPGS